MRKLLPDLSSACGCCLLISCGAGLSLPPPDFVTDWGHVHVITNDLPVDQDEFMFGLRLIADLVRDNKPDLFPRGIIKKGLEHYEPVIEFKHRLIRCEGSPTGYCNGTTSKDFEYIRLLYPIPKYTGHCLAYTPMGHEFIHYFYGKRTGYYQDDHANKGLFGGADGLDVQWFDTMREEFCDE